MNQDFEKTTINFRNFQAIQKPKKIGRNRHFFTSWGGSLNFLNLRILVKKILSFFNFVFFRFASLFFRFASLYFRFASLYFRFALQNRDSLFCLNFEKKVRFVRFASLYWSLRFASLSLRFRFAFSIRFWAKFICLCYADYINKKHQNQNQLITAYAKKLEIAYSE